jgi:hypothetical protein
MDFIAFSNRCYPVSVSPCWAAQPVLGELTSNIGFVKNQRFTRLETTEGRSAKVNELREIVLSN